MAERIASAPAVISPHLDDAVFGCGELLAAHPGSVVITVFAGVPAAGTPVPEWDRACGFSSPREALLERRREDRRALAALRARPCWLALLDAQYRSPPGQDVITERLERALLRHAARTVLLPMGLFHSDHRLVHEAALALARREPRREWLAYEEPNYRRVPGLLEERLQALRALGFDVTREALAPDDTKKIAKARAVRCYTSQLRGLQSAGRPGDADLLANERYWRIAA